VAGPAPNTPPPLGVIGLTPYVGPLLFIEESLPLDSQFELLPYPPFSPSPNTVVTFDLRVMTPLHP